MSYLEQLISNGNYTQALEFVREEMTRMRESGQIDEEQFYELYTKRILINQKLSKNDELITEAIRQEKYPASKEFILSKKTKVVLEFRNIFHKKSQAYVNTIHIEKFFNYSPVGLSYGFLKSIGLERIEEQISGRKTIERSDFIKLHHDDLNSPISFHIFYYNEDNIFDALSLEKGIINVLKESEVMKLKEIAMPALGYYYSTTAKDEEKNQIASQIADTISIILQSYFWDNKKTSIEVINLCFVNPFTFLRFENAFQKTVSMTKQQIYIQRDFNEIQKKILDSVKTRDPRFIELLKEVSYSVNTTRNIVLLGETGVGKTFLAKIIHENGSRRGFKMLSENCARLTKEVMYSQLFGAKEGSASDITKPIKGLLEAANGSTLFLDEIGNIDIKMQQALITFIEDKVFYRLGDNEKKIESNVRLIFGTNADLDELVAQGLMMGDFRERISQHVFEIPALRERKCDIKNIIKDILDKENEIQNQKYKLEMDDSAFELLENYSWPGNYRQLQNYVLDVYNICFYKGISIITRDLIEAKLPRDENVSIKKLEKILLSFLMEWNKDKGKFVDDIISPMIVKLYKDLQLNKSESDEFLGITGSSGKPPLFDKYLAKYPEIAERLNRK